MTDTEKYRADQLKIINNYRAKHGAGPLQMDTNLNNYAQEWANNLASRNSMYHRSNNQYGENIFMGTAPLHHNASKYWYDEISQYNFNNPQANMRNCSAIGHFTALVWKSSKRIGIGIRKSGSGQYLVVANFDPAGNCSGKFGANVLPPGTKPPQTTDTTAKKEPPKEKVEKVTAPVQKLVFHSGIQCDNCDEFPIMGIRYNCTVCDVYDLCEKCYNKGVHKEHINTMNKMTTPQSIVEKVNEMIKKFDVDGNGVIEFPEYWIMAKKLWKIDDETKIREGFESIDKSGDGKITVDEFKEFYMGTPRKEIVGGAIEELVNEFDVDKNGVIEYPEFWLMAKKLWKHMDENTIKADFKAIDQSGDGKLSVDELRAYFKEHISTKKPEKTEQEDKQDEEEEFEDEEEDENEDEEEYEEEEEEEGEEEDEFSQNFEKQFEQLASNLGATTTTRVVNTRNLGTTRVLNTRNLGPTTWFNTCGSGGGGGGGQKFYYTRQGG